MKALQDFIDMQDQVSYSPNTNKQGLKGRAKIGITKERNVWMKEEKRQE
jgi:hypothetical protein